MSDITLHLHIAPWFWHGLIGFVLGLVAMGLVAASIVGGILEGAFRNV